MPTNYPGALDALTNPVAADPLASVVVPHSGQHTNANDALEALQAKLGIGAGGAVSDTVLRCTAPGVTGWGKLTNANVVAAAGIPASKLSGASNTKLLYSGQPLAGGNAASFTLSGITNLDHAALMIQVSARLTLSTPSIAWWYLTLTSGGAVIATSYDFYMLLAGAPGAASNSVPVGGDPLGWQVSQGNYLHLNYVFHSMLVYSISTPAGLLKAFESTTMYSHQSTAAPRRHEVSGMCLIGNPGGFDGFKFLVGGADVPLMHVDTQVRVWGFPHTTA